MSLHICGQLRPRSDCANAQSDQGLHCPLTESLHTADCMNGDIMSRLYSVHVQDILNLHILCMLYFKALFHLMPPISMCILKC